MHLVRVVWYVWYVCKCFNGLLDIHFPVLNLNFPKRWLTLRRRVYAIRDQPQVQNARIWCATFDHIWPRVPDISDSISQLLTAAMVDGSPAVIPKSSKIIQNQWLHVVSNSYKSTTENDVNIFFFILESLRSQAPEQPWGGTYAACADHLPFDWVPSALAQRSAQVTGIHGFFQPVPGRWSPQYWWSMGDLNHIWVWINTY